MTALEVLNTVRAVGGRLIPDGDLLRFQIPEAEAPRLLPLLRERKLDLLKLLEKPDGDCPECNGVYYRQRPSGEWVCGTCTPDPHAARMRGVNLAVLGDRPITTAPPTSDLPAPGTWARTPAGAVAELVLYRADGGEVLMRGLHSGRLAWFDPSALAWEADWGRAS